VTCAACERPFETKRDHDRFCFARWQLDVLPARTITDVPGMPLGTSEAFEAVGSSGVKS
jgi:hypothetical protein